MLFNGPDSIVQPWMTRLYKRLLIPQIVIKTIVALTVLILYMLKILIDQNTINRLMIGEYLID